MPGRGSVIYAELGMHIITEEHVLFMAFYIVAAPPPNPPAPFPLQQSPTARQTPLTGRMTM